MKIFQSPSWIERSKTLSNESVELNLSNELKPYMAFITSSDNISVDGSRIGSAYGPDINQFSWTPASDGGYEISIPFTSHKKGFIFRNLTNSEINDGKILVFPIGEGDLPSNSIPNLIIPKVKTYSQVSGGIYEESYDSAKIDINTGEVKVFSLTNDPYLIIIY